MMEKREEIWYNFQMRLKFSNNYLTRESTNEKEYKYKGAGIKKWK